MGLITLQLGWSEMPTHLKQPDAYATLAQKSHIQLIDVRTPKEFAEGTIGNAQNIDYLAEDFSTNILALDKDQPVYVFCRSGNRSEQAREIMLDLGFTKVYDLDGGYNAWTEWLETQKEE